MKTRSDAYTAELRREFPRLRIVYKRDSAWSRFLGSVVRVVTLGGQSAFVTRYVTTIGATIYLPNDWDARADDEKYIVLRHEAVHLRQFKRYGLIGMSLLYLFPILPLGLAWGRARLEWEAYEETLRVIAEVKGASAAQDPALHTHIVKQFTSGAYGWMWPFPRSVQRWIDRAIQRAQ